MVEIVADSPVIEKEVNNLMDILIEAGSGFHSNLLIHEEGGGLSIKTTEPMDNGKEIIRLPRTVLMPGDQYMLDIVNDNFVVSYPEGSIVTDLQRRVIDKMFEIYNLTQKVKLHEEFSFLFSLKDVPGLIEKLGEGREFIVGPYKDWVRWFRQGMTQEQYKKVLCETYIKTRPLGYSDPVREASVSMIMPVLDFMNHNWAGGTFSVGQGGRRKGDLTMETSQPFDDSTECYANYGVMDPFDALVRYDFIDETSPVLRSVPLSLEGPGGDEIRIGANTSFMYKKDLQPDMRDLRRHIPDIKFDDDGMMRVSHIFVPTDQSKFALVRVLNLIMAGYNVRNNKKMTEEEVKAWRRKAQETVIEKNRAYYSELDVFMDKLPEAQQNSFGVKRIRDLVKHQMEKLSVYEIQE